MDGTTATGFVVFLLAIVGVPIGLFVALGRMSARLDRMEAKLDRLLGGR